MEMLPKSVVRIDCHGAKLQADELFPLEADTPLPEKYWSARMGEHQKSAADQQWRRANDEQEDPNNIERPLYSAANRTIKRRRDGRSRTRRHHFRISQSMLSVIHRDRPC